MGLMAHRQRARGLTFASRFAARFCPKILCKISWLQVPGSQPIVHEGQNCLRKWVMMFQKHHNGSVCTAPSSEDSEAVNRRSSQFLRTIPMTAVS